MDSELVTIIQKRFQKKLLHKKLKELENMINDLFLTVAENYDDKQNIEQIESEFDQMSIILRNQTVISKVQKFLDYVYRVYPENKILGKKVNSKILLSAFIMYGYPEITLDFSRKKIDHTITSTSYEMYFYSKILIFSLVNFMNNDFNPERLRKFIKYLNIYSNIFTLFLNEDKIKQINKVTFEYYQIKKTLKEITTSDSYEKDSKKEILENLNNTLKGLEEMLLIINPKYDLNNLKFYEEVLEKFDGILHKCFWDNYKLELEEEQPQKEKKEKIHKKLNEILQIYKSLNIKAITEKIVLLEKYTTTFNLESLEEWIDYCDLCVNIIMELQTPSRNQITNTGFQEIKCKSYTSITEVIIDILKFIFRENEIIFGDIYNFRIMINMGINPFVKK